MSEYQFWLLAIPLIGAAVVNVIQAWKGKKVRKNLYSTEEALKDTTRELVTENRHEAAERIADKHNNKTMKIVISQSMRRNLLGH